MGRGARARAPREGGGEGEEEVEGVVWGGAHGRYIIWSATGFRIPDLGFSYPIQGFLIQGLRRIIDAPMWWVRGCYVWDDDQARPPPPPPFLLPSSLPLEKQRLLELLQRGGPRCLLELGTGDVSRGPAQLLALVVPGGVGVALPCPYPRASCPRWRRRRRMRRRRSRGYWQKEMEIVAERWAMARHDKESNEEGER